MTLASLSSGKQHQLWLCSSPLITLRAFSESNNSSTEYLHQSLENLACLAFLNPFSEEVSCLANLSGNGIRQEEEVCLMSV